MTKIIPRFHYVGFIIAFLVLLSTDTIMAFGIEDRNLIYEQQNLIHRRPTKTLGQRKGFIFGLGAGVGNVNFAEPLAEYWGDTYDGDWPDPRGTTSAFATDVKLGHGFSNHFLLYYTSRITWMPLSNLYSDTMIVNGSAGVGMMLYPLRSSDLYLVTSFGFASLVTWQPPFKLERARPTGLTVSGGIGFELVRHLNIDFTVNYGNAQSTQIDDANELILTDEIVTFLVTLHVLFY